MSTTVIVGAGVAGVQTALDLRHRGFDGHIVLLSEECQEPYDRPPLSKEFLKGAVQRDGVCLLPAKTAREKEISLRLGCRAEQVRLQDREVVLSDGSTARYDYLVLATGAHNRPLRVPGADLRGVVSLRSLDEADELRQALPDAADVVIVGGGFIGLEVAAAAQAHGARVTVVEFLPRVMSRALSPEMSAHFTETHSGRGVDILTGVGVTEVLAGSGGAASAVALSDGTQIPADLVVVGIGVLPSTDLAADAGLDTSDGVLVDEQLRASDPHVFAIGDCARFECKVTGEVLRLESIQNAADQARFVAGRIVALDQAATDNRQGDNPEPASYAALPWFWSEQFDSKLQIAGVAPADAEAVVRGDPTSGSFSVCRFVGDRLVAVESINHARDHLAARKLLSADPARVQRVTRETVADSSIALKTLLD